MAADLHPWTPLKHSMSVKVADGATLVCSYEVISCSWTAQGVMFTTTFKILPLQCYDAILGMEWLETFSPMQIQWKEKWLSFNHQNSTIRLHGVQDAVATVNEITLNQLIAMEKQDLVWGYCGAIFC